MMELGQHPNPKQNFVFIICKGDDHIENDPYCQQLRNSGYQFVYQVPVLSFKFVNISSLAVKMSQVDSYCGLIFTSTRAVIACQQACSIDENLINVIRSKLIFPVGPKTLKSVKDSFHLDHCIGETNIDSIGSSELLARKIIDSRHLLINLSCQPLLLMPCSSIARETIPTTLEENGINVETIHCYETGPNDNLPQQLTSLISSEGERQIFLIIFSPSGVDSVTSALSSLSLDWQQFKFIAIGKTTAQALKDLDLSVFCVSEKPNPTSLTEAINKALESPMV
ncbi:uroporphyrinogen-III synthase-like [Panonychus citri]|uniref:uroporphyrinogen-III synthase-like n=1 Tax=Panonychus citri TaxID=50023 RepID=UPI002307F6FD|nr:uroporphyrinogen-III synthase-like [Panonychus citri]